MNRKRQIVSGGRISLLLFLLSACSLSLSGANESKESEFLVEALEYAVKNSPYVAVVEDVDVTVNSENNIDDEHVYQVRVIETFRGPKLLDLSYTMVVGKGESVSLASKPYIVTLCGEPTNFYWPGTGANFPVNEVTLRVVQSVLDSLDSGENKFSNCD